MPSKTSAHRVHGAEQRRKAMELRRTGMTFDQIGQALGIAGPTAYEHVKKALAEAREHYRTDANEQIELDLQRLDAMYAALQPTMNDPRAVQAMLGILDRRAKLLGLDAPAKQEISGSMNLVNPFDLRTAIERDLKARLNGNGGATHVPTNGTNGTGGNGHGSEGI